MLIPSRSIFGHIWPIIPNFSSFSKDILFNLFPKLQRTRLGQQANSIQMANLPCTKIMCYLKGI